MYWQQHWMGAAQFLADELQHHVQNDLEHLAHFVAMALSLGNWQHTGS
jgi:hypothetical protein